MLNFFYAIYFIVLFAVFTGSLIRYKEKVCKYLFFLLLLSIVTELFAINKNFENYLYYVVFTPVECVLVNILLTEHVFKKSIRITAITFSIAFSILCIEWLLTKQTSYPTKITAIEDLILIVGCLLSFSNLQPSISVSITQRSMFWITLGFFIYFLETFAVNTMYNSWQKVELIEASDIHKYVNVIINIISYILIGYGLYLNKWEKKYTQRS